MFIFATDEVNLFALHIVIDIIFVDLRPGKS